MAILKKKWAYPLNIKTGVKNMKKQIGPAILLLVLASIFCGIVSAEEAISPGPKPGSGDGYPDGNQFIQPDTPGDGPAPNSGDGESDGSGFETK